MPLDIVVQEDQSLLPQAIIALHIFDAIRKAFGVCAPVVLL
jgi:hypothetical protein